VEVPCICFSPLCGNCGEREWLCARDGERHCDNCGRNCTLCRALGYCT
jgi:hypothetical protein